MTLRTAPQPNRIATDRCAACGDLLTDSYYTLLDRPEHYCPRCIRTRPRCASCGAPLGDQHWTLHDGRLQCASCHRTAIYDPIEAERLYQETVRGVIGQLGLTLNIGVAFRLLDAPTLDGLRLQGTHTGYPPEQERLTLGLYHRRGHLRVIYMLYGLPRLLFRTTVAHEYAHAWQAEHCPLLSDDVLREGFAEWVAYHHLRWLGATKAAHRLLNSPHPYRPALDSVLALEQRLGIAGVIEHLRRAE